MPADIISGYTKRTDGGKEVYDVTMKTPDIFPIVSSNCWRIQRIYLTIRAVQDGAESGDAPTRAGGVRPQAGDQRAAAGQDARSAPQDRGYARLRDLGGLRHRGQDGEEREDRRRGAHSPPSRFSRAAANQNNPTCTRSSSTTSSRSCARSARASARRCSRSSRRSTLRTGTRSTASSTCTTSGTTRAA